MDFKQYYINGHSHIDIKISKYHIRILPHMNWNNLMAKLTELTTFNTQYDVVIYPYNSQYDEQIESWYIKPKAWLITRGKGTQVTRSTFIKRKEK